MASTTEFSKSKCSIIFKRKPRRQKTTPLSPGQRKNGTNTHTNNGNLENSPSAVSLPPVSPVRQTAPVFKLPVTVIRTGESQVIIIHDPTKGENEEKPKQLCCLKRLQGLRPCHKDGTEMKQMELPPQTSPLEPNVDDETALRSIASVFHLTAQPVTGRKPRASRLIRRNPCAYLDPRQPLAVLK